MTWGGSCAIFSTFSKTKQKACFFPQPEVMLSSARSTCGDSFWSSPSCLIPPYRLLTLCRIHTDSQHSIYSNVLGRYHLLVTIPFMICSTILFCSWNASNCKCIYRPSLKHYRKCPHSHPLHAPRKNNQKGTKSVVGHRRPARVWKLFPSAAAPGKATWFVNIRARMKCELGTQLPC